MAIIKDIIDSALNQLERKERGDETIVVLKDDASQALRDSMMRAHGDRMPDDWIFSIYYEILSVLGGYTLDTIDAIDDNRAEIVDGAVDVYTAGLTKWLASNVNNVAYITEALKENGPETDGFMILAMAQYHAIDEIYGEVASYISNQMAVE